MAAPLPEHTRCLAFEETDYCVVLWVNYAYLHHSTLWAYHIARISDPLVPLDLKLLCEEANIRIDILMNDKWVDEGAYKCASFQILAILNKQTNAYFC